MNFALELSKYHGIPVLRYLTSTEYSLTDLAQWSEVFGWYIKSPHIRITIKIPMSIITCWVQCVCKLSVINWTLLAKKNEWTDYFTWRSEKVLRGSLFEMLVCRKESLTEMKTGENKEVWASLAAPPPRVLRACYLSDSLYIMHIPLM